MEHGSSATSRKNTRPEWLKPGEVWGGDNSDNPEVGRTLGLCLKRWYRGNLDRNEGQEARTQVFGSKVTLRKLVVVLTATVAIYLFLHLALPSVGRRTEVSSNANYAVKQSH